MDPCIPESVAEEFAEIPVSLSIPAEQPQPGRQRILPLVYPDIGAHDRFDACRKGRPVKTHHREQIALVGERDRRHARVSHRLHQGFDSDDAVCQ
jgi:hypothetical protein